MVSSASVMFGFNGNLSRLLFDDGVSLVTLVELRMLIGSICLLGVLAIGRRQELKVSRRSIGWIIVFGLSLALMKGGQATLITTKKMFACDEVLFCQKFCDFLLDGS